MAAYTAIHYVGYTAKLVMTTRSKYNTNLASCTDPLVTLLVITPFARL